MEKTLVMSASSPPIVRVLPDPQRLAEAAAEYLIESAHRAISTQGGFSLGLAGGSTPKMLYQLLSEEPYRGRVDWSAVEVFFGDERCVPPDHPDSNYRMAYESLLSRVGLGVDRIHQMKGEIDPEQAAREYDALLESRFGAEGLDLLLLGLGEDGHTASLFPGTPALHETTRRCVAQFVPNSTTGPSWRLTLTAPFINRCREVLMLVAGAKKASVVDRVLTGPNDPDHLPVQRVAPESGRLIWMLDAAAAGMSEP